MGIIKNSVFVRQNFKQKLGVDAN
ncbi:uncharacterized protein METZ01_LOCUS507063 [marine metagenome]|uniref:Uncharacterized protein n=1 Tax=marine metagenome TaxID=408172 RepID=A0A383EC65_9ZZZZ